MGFHEGLLSQEGVIETGGGVRYDPNEDYWEIRFDTEGNPYNSKPHVPLHPGHTKAKQPMFDIPQVDVPTPPSIVNYGDEYYYQDYVQPQTQYDVNPTQEQSLGTPTDQTTQFDNRTIFQTDDGRLQSEQSVSVTIDGKVYTAPSIQPQINPNRPLTWQEVSDGIINGTIQPTSIHEGPTAIEDANNQAQIRSDSINVNPMSLYNRQGRADYTPQDTYSPNTIFDHPNLESLPDPTTDAYAEQDYYAEQERQAKIEAQYQALLKAQGIKEEDEADTAMFQADFDRENLDAEWEEGNALRVLQQLKIKEDRDKRIAELESYNIPDPMENLLLDTGKFDGVSGPMSPNLSPDTSESLQQAQTQHRQDWLDTDDFGNPMFDANSFGQTQYDKNAHLKIHTTRTQYGATQA